MNIGYLLLNSALKYPNRITMISEGKRISYKLFNLRANKVAQAMKGCTLKKGDRVAIMFFSSYQFAEIYFTAAKIGAVAPREKRLRPL